ncbi:MAG: shikimate dehydrogenase [Christensenellales bacterium]
MLGQSLPHTWSPYIHNSLFDAAGLDAVYLPVTVPPERLGSVTDVFRSCFSGFNVTIPYKEKILPFLDDVDEAAQVCGAVNTVEIRNGRMIGHITDGLGMLRAIEERGVKTHQADVLILGGGGAARVAGYAFLSRGGRVTFAVRDAQKGNALAHALAQTQQDGLHRLSVRPLADCAEAHDILINCTPVGMYPHVDACPVSADVIARCGAVFDAVYNPRETRLLTLARQNGLPAIEGLGMLFYQAVEAQKFWFGDRVASKAEQSRIYSELQTRL